MPISYSEPPIMGTYKVFDLNDNELTITSVVGQNGTPKVTTIALNQATLSSIRTRGRNTKMMKGSVSVLFLIGAIVWSISSFASPDVCVWVWLAAAFLAFPFFLWLVQSLRISEVEVFKDERGFTVFEINCPKTSDADFELFLAALKTAILQNKAPPVAAGTGPSTANAPIPSSLQQTRTDGSPTAAEAELLKKIKSSANWLYWVAGLSGLNLLFAHLEVSWRFAMGLGITELVYAIGLQTGTVGTAVAAYVTVGSLGCLIVLGYLATKHHAWAFIAGIVALSLDTLLLVGITGTEFLIGIVFHVVAIVFLWLGYKALRRLQKLRAVDV